LNRRREPLTFSAPRRISAPEPSIDQLGGLSALVDGNPARHPQVEPEITLATI
jgi:hypothetical protein